MTSKVVDVTGHRLEIPAVGSPVTVHPAEDIPDCGFEEYVASDWADPPAPFYRPANLAFTRHTNEQTGQVYWNSGPA